MSEVRREFVADQLWLLIAIVTLPVVVLVSLLGIPFGGEVVAVLGWLLLTPMFLLWGDEIAAMRYGSEAKADEGTTTDPVGVLKRRYARGEIDEEEFEERLERLLDVERLEEQELAAASSSE